MMYPDPDLLTVLHCARQLKADEVRQVEAMTGLAYDPDSTATTVFSSKWLMWAVTGDAFPVCVGGYQWLRPGVWTCWMLSTPEAWGKHRFSVTRAIKQTLKGLFDSGAHRVELVSLADRETAHDWYVRCLGFHCESKMAAWGAKGEDAFLFARLRSIT